MKTATITEIVIALPKDSFASSFFPSPNFKDKFALVPFPIKDAIAP